MIKIKKGLNLPITGSPQQGIADGPDIRSVAVVGPDYIGMKPTMAVAVGDRVRLGDLLFTDKKTEGVRYTAQASGIVSAIHRGEKRVLQSVVIDVDGDDAVDFGAHTVDSLSSLGRDKIAEVMVESGLWTALRTRPFSRVPAPGTSPCSIFVTAMDTNPLAANPEVVIGEQSEAFEQGLVLLKQLTDGAVYLCKAPGAQMPAGPAEVEEFDGPHPAGLAGTHIHFIDPVSTERVVWTVGYQDVIAIGKLFTTGKLWTERVVSVAGPQVERPALVRTRLGASIEELTAGNLKAGENRLVAGSVFGGRTARGSFAFLGRYHNQVSVLLEGRERPMLHYLTPGTDRHSVMPTYVSHLMNKLFSFTTSTNGSERAMVPVGSYEKVMPLDILPTQLLRSLIYGDIVEAATLGALELDEEDLALCSYVCPGKYEYGPILRDNLTRIIKEG
ncbi:Na(+)-translocating NADH-quinone reductase subunit A [Sansalvadorimonas sp. 2012CJ34-2]|uniref:Na(+)-translocating NADH-quinone reductase subunit A n=1 Tax=Parendozoicomonas callyspongiae TaxID=2942213 RepID=A0ABT0PES8_9GAMM|nr:Na(+)-translocating NADH-quinone reductase subunit A [Sansalvadorimonas sp. 2012CJ34-2]MCL6269815.1 Na(+)-translocating NADH-quinone reductase subunit A [Sansalvadorimonas sp. 2012CJ34-2]